MNYRTRLLLAISSVSMLTLVFIALNSFFFLKNVISERVVNKVTAIGEILVEEILEDYLQDDLQGLRNILQIAGNQPNLEFVSIISDRNTILFSSDRTLENRLNPYTDSGDIRKEKKDVFIRSFPFSRTKTVLSRLQIGYSLKGLRVSLRKAALWSLGLSATAFLLTLGAAWFFSGRLLRPLEEMTVVSNKIAEGDFSSRVKSRTEDVIGQLGQSLNRMAEHLDELTRNQQAKIEQATSQLGLANRELQRKTMQLEQSNQRLVALDKLKSEFVSIVSHELRTPLTGIIGFAQTLQTVPLPEPQKEKYLKIIESEGKRLAYLVEEFLDISKIDSGNIDLRMDRISLAEVIRETIGALNIPGGIAIECSLPDDPLPAEGDKNRMKQVLMNIVDNALRYTRPSGKIVITGKSAADAIVVSVQDEGPGIPTEQLDKIFQKFFRGMDEISRKSKGSGLGLAIAKGIVESHRGTIWVESHVGKGSTFHFSIPRRNDHGQKDIDHRR